jgi:hypothetical protein
MALICPTRLKPLPLQLQALLTQRESAYLTLLETVQVGCGEWGAVHEAAACRQLAKGRHAGMSIPRLYP